MEKIIDYFATIPSAHRSLMLVGGIAFFWILENTFPLFKLSYKKWQHAFINIFFTATTVLINFSLAYLLLLTSNYSIENHFGLLQWFHIENIWLFSISGILFLDFFGAYLVHFVQHKTPVLWRLHLIHHSDTWVDTTTANRHHPGESVLRFIFTCGGVALVGAPIWMVFLYQSISLIATQFNHANLNMPKKLDLFLSYIIVSPNMHKVHHHYIMPYTDSNYGNIFSIWDRLFGTYKYLPNDAIIYGIDTHQKPEEHNAILSLLKIPFQASKKSLEK
jgi:sterol desaturase/sphingolipid hydroxylase (fatty acid hydroxylase superfamily)